MPGKDFHPQEPHPAEWEQDLNPDFMAGTNYGSLGDNPQTQLSTAYDIKEAYNHPLLRDLADDELKRINVLPQGTRLEQGATYIDLHKTKPQEFKATGNMVAGPHNWYVPKKNLDYPMWNHLIGVTNPERLDAE